MKCLVKVHMDKNSESHFNLRLFEKKAVIVIVLKNIDERFIMLKKMKMVILKDMDVQLCVKHWPKILRHDVLFQREVLALFGAQSVESMTQRVSAIMQKNGKHPDFYDSTNMEKIKNYIINIVGPIDDNMVKSIREQITADLV